MPGDAASSGTEVGGRFSTEVVQLLQLLAPHRAAAVLIAVAAQRAFAASCFSPAADLGDGQLHELLAEAR